VGALRAVRGGVPWWYGLSSTRGAVYLRDSRSLWTGQRTAARASSPPSRPPSVRGAAPAAAPPLPDLAEEHRDPETLAGGLPGQELLLTLRQMAAFTGVLGLKMRQKAGP